MKTKLRSLVSLLIIIVLGFSPALAYAQSISPQSTADVQLTSGILTLTNADRAQNGAGALTENTTLDRVAQQKADDMLQKQYFAHTSPDGTAPWTLFTQNGYSYIYAAENLAMNFSTADAVEAAWMNSPGHRANIVNGNYKEIGFGVARGTYQGQPVIFIVEEFGTQSGAAVSAIKATTLTPAPAIATKVTVYKKKIIRKDAAH